MAGIARKSDPALWDKVKAAVTASAEGGKPGQWSARKAQRATAAYQQQGGGYLGAKQADNHLAEWTREDWGTRSGAESLDSGERYLPRAARERLTPAEYRRSSARKRQDLAAGRQVSPQPADIARKAAAARHHPTTGKGKSMGESDRHHDGDPDDSKDRHDDVAAEFRRLVNIPAAELRPWLDTWESQAVGFTREGEDEAVGHRSGRRILELLEGEDDETPADTAFRREVVGYIHRHLAQRPDGDVADTRWRHSLMNWGHDPMRDTSESTTMNSEDTSQSGAPMTDAAPESGTATPAPRKPRARRAKATEDGVTPARKPRTAKPAAEANPARKPARSTRGPAKATAARSSGTKSGTASTARRSAAAAPKRATSTAATKRAATPAKRATTTTKRAAAPAKRATATTKRAAAPAKRATATTKRASAPAKRATAAPAKRTPAKRPAATTAKRAAPAKRGALATTKRSAAATTKRAAPAKRATAATPKRGAAATTKRGAVTTTKRGAVATTKRGAVATTKRATPAKRPAATTASKRTTGAATKRTAAAAPKRGAVKTAAPKRAPAKAKPAARGAAGRTSAAAKGGRSSTPRNRG